MSMITFEVNVLGFRQLKSMGILPVKKAFVVLDFKSLLPKDNDLFDVENKQTEPGPSGPDPTINTLLQYKLPLPVERKICPILQCTVKDNIFSGQFQPVIGQFSIELGAVLLDKNNEYQENIDQLKNIVKELKNIRDVGSIPQYSQSTVPMIDGFNKKSKFKSI